MSLDVTQEQRGEVRVLGLAGRLDGDSAAALQIAVDENHAAGGRHFLFDLSGLGYLSSAGLKVMQDIAVRAKTDGSLRLCALAAPVREAMTGAGVLAQFSIYPDRTAALADHPAARVDPALVKAATGLMGATTEAGASKASPELARAAADLLGAGGAKPAKPAPQPIQRGPNSKTKQADDDPGLVGKLRKLFKKD